MSLKLQRRYQVSLRPIKLERNTINPHTSRTNETVPSVEERLREQTSLAVLRKRLRDTHRLLNKMGVRSFAFFALFLSAFRMIALDLTHRIPLRAHSCSSLSPTLLRHYSHPG